MSSTQIKGGTRTQTINSVDKITQKQLVVNTSDKKNSKNNAQNSDDVSLKSEGRVGKADFGNIFYDINIEVDEFLPHTNHASGIKESTSIGNSVSQTTPTVNTNSMQNSKNNAQNSDDVSLKSEGSLNMEDELTEAYKLFSEYVRVQKANEELLPRIDENAYDEVQEAFIMDIAQSKFFVDELDKAQYKKYNNTKESTRNNNQNIIRNIFTIIYNNL